MANEKLPCTMLLDGFSVNLNHQQECIPVGCVLSTAVAILGGVSAYGRVCLLVGGGCLPHPMNRMTDRQV